MKILRILVLIISLAFFANAQNVLLTGTIYDLNGAVIPNTKVTAKDKTGKTYLSVQSNSDGVYTLLLPKGTYSLEFNATCFKAFKLKNYRIVKNYPDKMFLDTTLKVSCKASDSEGFF